MSIIRIGSVMALLLAFGLGAAVASVEEVSVPDVRGMTKDEALRALAEAGLRVERIGLMSESRYRELTGGRVAPGTIVQQNPPPSTASATSRLERGSAVLLRMVEPDPPAAQPVEPLPAVPEPPMPTRPPFPAPQTFPTAPVDRPAPPAVIVPPVPVGPSPQPVAPAPQPLDLEPPAPTPAVVAVAAPGPTAPGVRLQQRGFNAWAEALYMTFRPADTAFTISDPAGAFTPSGRIESLAWEYEWGVRGGLRYGPEGRSWDVGAQAMWLESSAREQVLAPPGGGLGVVLYNANNAPPTVAGPVSAEGRIELLAVDVTGGISFDIGSDGAGRVFLGGRYAKLDQSYDVIYDDSVPNGNIYTRNAAMDVEAYGAVVGFEGAFEIGSGFGLFGRLAGAMMVGQFRGSLLETQTTVAAGAVRQVDVQDRFERIVPVLETAVGVSWDSGRGALGGNTHLRVRIGYEFQNWFNVLDVNQFPDDLADQLLTRNTTDLGLDGITGRIDIYL